MQAFQYGWPLIYFAKLIWQWTMNLRSVQLPLNSWTTTRHFVATSFYSEEGGTLNTDTVYAGSFIDLCKRPVVISPFDSDDR